MNWKYLVLAALVVIPINAWAEELSVETEAYLSCPDKSPFGEGDIEWQFGVFRNRSTGEIYFTRTLLDDLTKKIVKNQEDVIARLRFFVAEDIGDDTFVAWDRVMSTGLKTGNEFSFEKREMKRVLYHPEKGEKKIEYVCTELINFPKKLNDLNNSIININKN